MLIQTDLGLIEQDILDWLISLGVLRENPNKSEWAVYGQFRILGTKLSDGTLKIERLLSRLSQAQKYVETTKPSGLFFDDFLLWRLLKDGKCLARYEQNGRQYEHYFVFEMAPLEQAITTKKGKSLI